MKIYLAAPFFNPEQIATVEKIEDCLTEFSQDLFYSPRRDGVLMDMTPEERKKASAMIYFRNVEKMNWADTIVAVIDGRDQGVLIEIGFCIAKRMYEDSVMKVITYTDHDYGLNVMMKEAVDSHCKGIDRLRACLLSKEWHKFRDFDPTNVT